MSESRSARLTRDYVLRQTPTGWRIEGADGTVVDGLLGAIVLADLLGPSPKRGHRPDSSNADDECDQLRQTVAQLRHALDTRVVIERGIGVLTERLRVSPLEAYERMRREARATGGRIDDLAAQVIASVTGETEGLPASLR